MFTNVIMTIIKMHFDFNIIIVINCSCLQLHMHICPKPSLFTLSHGVQRRPHTYQKIYRLLFQNQILLLTLTIPSSAFYQTLFHPIPSSLKLFTYIFPQPFHITTQTSQSFSDGIAFFSSSIFSINAGSGPLVMFLFVVFVVFFSVAQAILCK